MIIDIHTHMIHGKEMAALEAVGGNSMKQRIKSLQGVTTKKPHAMDVTSRVAQMDQFGIDYQLATPFHHLDPNGMPLDADVEIKVSRLINDSMARITEESRGRILCAGAIPMNSLENEGLKEMERVVKELGLKGFGTLTNIKGKPLDVPEYRPFWAKAAELDAPVFIHPMDPVTRNDRSYEDAYDLMLIFGWPFETTLALCRLVFSGIMDQFDSLKIVSHHLGGMIPFYWGRMSESYIPEFAKRRGTALNKPLKEYFSRFYYDTAVGMNPGAVRCAYELFGGERLVLATDAPFGPGTGEERLESYPRLIKELGLPQKDTANILGENAKRLLKI